MNQTNFNRGEERIRKALPVHIGSATGVTRDFSASGMYFETNIFLPVGSPVEFSVEFKTPVGKMELHCSGKVLRAEPSDSSVGVAVKIIQSVMLAPQTVDKKIQHW